MVTATQRWRWESAWERPTQSGQKAAKLQALPSNAMSAHLDGNGSILLVLELLWTGHLPLLGVLGEK